MVINGKEYVLVHKGRFFAFILLIVALIFFICFSSKVIGSSGREEEETFVRYTVEPGDTLWDIASKYRGRTEIRRYVHKLMKTNEMVSADIFAGDVLLIPVDG